MKKKPKLLYNSNVAKLLQTTARDLVNHNHMPDYFTDLYLEPTVFKSAVHNYIRQGIREFVCPVCMINIKAPEKWIEEHHMSHVMKTRNSEKVKDEEQQVKSEFHVY